MKKIILVLALAMSFILSGCETTKFKDELISAKSQTNTNEKGEFFLVWASYTKDKEVVYNYYHKSQDGKIQLSYSNVYDVSIYEDVPIDESEYIIYDETDIMYNGRISNPEFHVHKGSIQPVIDIDVNK
jgi:hypothetical protein